jgi:hypothetical protein
MTNPGDSESLKRNYLDLHYLLKRSRPISSKELSDAMEAIRDKVERYADVERQLRSGCYHGQKLASQQRTLRDEIIGLRPRLETAYFEAVKG